MNINKRLRPNLLDPVIEKKIIKTLKPIQPDYWAPTKNKIQSIYLNFIKPNIFLLLFIFFIILLLIYRYQTTKKDREKRELEKNYENLDDDNKNNSIKNKMPKKEINEYTNLLLQLYNHQKENLREPLAKKSSKSKYTMSPKHAYPMYPYDGGSLAPSNSR